MSIDGGRRWDCDAVVLCVLMYSLLLCVFCFVLTVCCLWTSGSAWLQYLFDGRVLRALW